MHPNIQEYPRDRSLVINGDKDRPNVGRVAPSAMCVHELALWCDGLLITQQNAGEGR